MKRTFLIWQLVVALVAAWGINAGDAGNRQPGPQPGGGPGMFRPDRQVGGVEIEDPKAGPRLDALPFGAEKRQVFNVPVGGIDKPERQASGWKMEAIFKLTDEQIKAVEALREEYASEQKKLEAEAQTLYAGLAEKVKQLRSAYEVRANEVLPAEDKARKEKIDALIRETNTKNAQLVKDMGPFFDLSDFQQRMALSRALREKFTKNAQNEQAKLLVLVPAESREKLEEVFKQSMPFGGAPGGMPGGEAAGEAVRPPRPPAADRNLDF